LLESSDVRLQDGIVWYHILKQQRGEDNREYVQLRDEGERDILRALIQYQEGKLFDLTLNEIRDELRKVQQDHDIPQLKLKDFRHTRVSHLKAAGWSDVRIRDEYTKHKHLSTLQDKYMSYVPEEVSEQDIWNVLVWSSPREIECSTDTDAIERVISRYGL
jgi:integrase